MKLFSKNRCLDLSHINVMGILNVTPDSFSQDGIYKSLNKAIDKTNLMIQEGASIIDIGGESTRPGAEEVSVEEELSRVIPVIKAISQKFDIFISVNTSKPEVMYESERAGAHLINDVCSLTKPGALEAAVKTELAVCLMHMQNKPKTMQNLPKYNNVLSDVNDFFLKHIKRCEHSGIPKQKLLLDPGFGFGKSLSHNYTLLAHLYKFHHFGLPLLVGMSRKSMIGKLLNVGINRRLNGSLSCAVIASMQGVHIIRVHNVRETVEAVRIVGVILQEKENKRYE